MLRANWSISLIPSITARRVESLEALHNECPFGLCHGIAQQTRQPRSQAPDIPQFGGGAVAKASSCRLSFILLHS
jgi:hypothetical protein